MLREITAADVQRVFELREKDARMRALAMSCASYAKQEYGPIDPECADRAASDIAHLAANLVVSMIYLEDAELGSLKEENGRLRKLAFDTALASPPHPISVKL